MELARRPEGGKYFGVRRQGISGLRCNIRKGLSSQGNSRLVIT